ncbi:MAG: small multi-drug export protein [Halobacteriota archaeon]|nr:small multi-drug export protein [Halobacteriota archaeon]
MFSEIFEVILLAMSPMVHSGAVPLGLARELNPAIVLLASFTGNIISVSLLLLILSKYDTYLKGRPFYELTVKRARTSCERYVNSYGAIGLVLFVMTPGAGTWMGCIAAFITGMNRRVALLAIALGVLVSEILILATCLGIITAWDNVLLRYFTQV